MASAKPKPKLSESAEQGLRLAKSGDCVAAVPKLEAAELEGHRPLTAEALAACHVALGELLLAHEIFVALTDERVDTAWEVVDFDAMKRARRSATELALRLPKLRLNVDPRGAVLEVRVGGMLAREPRSGVLIPPDEKTTVVIGAPGFQPETLEVLLSEGEEKDVILTLKPLGQRKVGEPDEGGDEGSAGPTVDLPTHSLGLRFRGLLIPKPVMNLVAEGGTNLMVPGAGLTYTARLKDVDLEPSLTVFNYNLPTTPFKPTDRPDTEWELVEADLWGGVLALDVLFRVPLDDASRVEFRIGGGFGVGWAFAGGLYRWQSFPTNGEPGDPARYEKCLGPNDPAGTFRYCNQLDKDAHRYGENDRTWGEDGARPVLYPWLALPELGFAFRPHDNVAIDLEVGATLSGLLMGTGLRFGLP